MMIKLLSLVLLLLPVVKAWFQSDGIIECDMTPSGQEFCGLNDILMGPSPVFRPDCLDGSCNEYQYEGGWAWGYSLTEGLPEGTDTYVMSPQKKDEHFTGGKLSIILDDDAVTCRVGGCQSCTVCEWHDDRRTYINTGVKFAADCTNLDNGRMVECQSPGPAFYPFALSEGGGGGGGGGSDSDNTDSPTAKVTASPTYSPTTRSTTRPSYLRATETFTPSQPSPPTEIPTEASVVPTTEPPVATATRTPSQPTERPSMAPSTWTPSKPTERPSVAPSTWTPFSQPTEDPTDASVVATTEPSVATATWSPSQPTERPTDASAVPTIQTPFQPTGNPTDTSVVPTTAEPTAALSTTDSDAVAPTAAPLVVEGGVQDPDPSSPDTDDSTTKVLLLIDASVVIDFFPGTGKQPSSVEIDALVAQTSAFFKKRLETGASGDLALLNPSPQYDATRAPDEFKLGFVVQVTLPSEGNIDAQTDGTTQDINDTMAESDFEDYIVNYVRNLGLGPQRNAFSYAFKVFYKGITPVSSISISNDE